MTGRPTKYKPEYCDEIIAFFDVPVTEEVTVTITKKTGESYQKTETRGKPLKFLTAFARHIGVTRSTLHKWTTEHPDFSDAYACVKGMQLEHLATCALMGLFNPGFAQFTAKNISTWTDKVETKHSGDVRIGPPVIG